MVKYATKSGTEDPYTIPHKGPVPKIDVEEGLPPGGLDIAWVEDWRKNLYHWSEGLKWYDRLHAHATLNSARKNVKCKRPFAPKDELDYVLAAAYCPTNETFSEKADPYIQVETAFGDHLNAQLHTELLKRRADPEEPQEVKKNLRKPKWQPVENFVSQSWRVFKNRTVVYPEKTIPTGHPIKYSGGGGEGGAAKERKENIYNVKLGIAADHSPQTNPGYSRTPSGAFYSI